MREAEGAIQRSDREPEDGLQGKELGSGNNAKEGCKRRRGVEEKGMNGLIPQLCLWSSSLMSPQSLSPSQIQDEAMHLPSSQRNCSVLQVLTSVAEETQHIH